MTFTTAAPGMALRTHACRRGKYSHDATTLLKATRFWRPYSTCCLSTDQRPHRPVSSCCPLHVPLSQYWHHQQMVILVPVTPLHATPLTILWKTMSHEGAADLFGCCHRHATQHLQEHLSRTCFSRSCNSADWYEHQQRGQSSCSHAACLHMHPHSTG